MYLWHWPILVLLPYVIERPPGLLARVLILVATVVAAWLTKVLVEDPVRTTGRLRLRQPPVALGAAAVAAMLLVGACGTAWWDVEKEIRQSASLAQSMTENNPPCFGAAALDPKARGCPNPDLEGSIVPAVTAAAGDYPFYPECEEQMSRRPLRPCEFGPVDDKSVPHIAVIGDSHARALMPALIELAKKRLLSVDLFTGGGCMWGKGRPNIHDKSLRDACTSLKKSMQPLLLKTAKQYDFILTTAWTNKYLPPIDSPVQALRASWKPIAATGVPIVAVRDNPSAGGSPRPTPTTAWRRSRPTRRTRSADFVAKRALDQYEQPFRERSGGRQVHA